VKSINTGNSSFEALIQGDYLYVDKTKYLYELVKKPGKYYFLSRPRRFGKSLTLSTLEAIFKNKRELFKGLYIDSTDYSWKEYPVIHIDFSKCARNTVSGICDWMNCQIIAIASSFKVRLREKDGFDSNLDKLITKLKEKEKVVVLIDEYDSLLINNINNENLEDIRLTLRGFYSVLKSQSENIRMCFITGVTKFSKMSIFSSMNNLTDISMQEDYATMLGYTQQEMEENFAEHIERSVSTRQTTREKFLEEVKNWYDGYKFSPRGESVYNPVSVGSFFSENSEVFTPYWINTGGMSFLLTEIAKRVNFDISLDLESEVSVSTLGYVDLVQMLKTEVNKENFMALLYQTGYLTIKNATLIGDSYLITLGYPNKEVRKGLNEILLPLYLGSKAGDFKGERVLKSFYFAKVDEAMATLSSIFASIPYHELVFNAENACHAAFLSMLTLMGAQIVSEEPTNIGRIDAVITCPKDIYIIEFKFNQSSSVAIEQIKEKKYYEPYLTCGKTIHLLGINFSTEQKNILEWKDEIL
jgi:hypothetical protein